MIHAWENCKFIICFNLLRLHLWSICFAYMQCHMKLYSLPGPAHRMRYVGELELLARRGGLCGICRKPPRLDSCDDDAGLMAKGIAYLRKAAADDE
jgi:hypothetical protein